MGLYRTDKGHWVKYGLCNGSSDLIGWTEYVVRPEDVGRKMAVFTAIETKASKGGRKREEQLNFISAVQRAGGIAGFATSENEAAAHVETWRGN